MIPLSASALPFRINLMEDGSVVTADGEYLGTWGTDDSDAVYEFTPDGENEPLLMNPFVKFLCEQIENWHTGAAVRDEP